MPDERSPSADDSTEPDRQARRAEANESVRLARLSRRASFAEIVSGTFHEFNNFLQVIGGLVELLGNRTDLPDSVVTKLDRMRVQTDRAA